MAVAEDLESDEEDDADVDAEDTAEASVANRLAAASVPFASSRQQVREVETSSSDDFSDKLKNVMSSL
jgi:hypothetical protein